MISIRHSLEKIRHSKNTGQRPVVVSCDDLEDYLCKYALGVPANNLMTEWIVGRAASCIGINIPDSSLVEIGKEHRPGPEVVIWNGARLDLPAFGLQYIEALEVDQSLILLFKKKSERNKICDKTDLLRIALFDIWTANEDRHDGNYNLLMQSKMTRIIGG